jgi:hypothetical protein
VNVSDLSELRDWARYWGASEYDVREAVRDAGSAMLHNVEVALRRKGIPPRRD